MHTGQGGRIRRSVVSSSLHTDDVQAVIASAKARGTASLERFIRKECPQSSDAEVKEAVHLAVQIIDSVPALLAEAVQEAEKRGVGRVVEPLLAEAVRYFVRPVDLIPEMTQGLPGLLDDAYLALRILQNLDRGPAPLLGLDLEYPIAFIRRLVGERIGRQLDLASLAVMAELADHFTRAWEHAPKA